MDLALYQDRLLRAWPFAGFMIRISFTLLSRALATFILGSSSAGMPFHRGRKDAAALGTSHDAPRTLWVNGHPRFFSSIPRLLNGNYS